MKFVPFVHLRYGRLPLLAVVAVLSIAGATAAVAVASGKDQASTATAGQVPGYKYVESAPITNPAGSQTGGTVLCTSGQPVTGGGVFGASSATTQSLNSSYPIDGADADTISDDGWGAFVNNASTTDSRFTVWAICRVPSP